MTLSGSVLSIKNTNSDIFTVDLATTMTTKASFSAFTANTEAVITGGTYANNLITFTSSTNNTFTVDMSEISQTAGVIGSAEDGDYTDGLFADFATGTTVGTAVDRFNEVLKALAPSPPGFMDSASVSGSFATGKLSFGSSNNDVSYSLVNTDGGNSAVNINGTYSSSGGRKGIHTSGNITGTLNDDITDGEANGIPYLDYAFQEGYKGSLYLYVNDSKVDSLNLSGSTAATNSVSGYVSVTAVKNVKFASGEELDLFKYRTATYSLPTSLWRNGMNYYKIIHDLGSTSYTADTYEFVYDNDGSSLQLDGTTSIYNLSMGGLFRQSGVKYYRTGTVQFSGTVLNVYKNVYTNGSAVSFTSRVNLDNYSSITLDGSGFTSSSSSSTLPSLDATKSTPQSTELKILATLSLPSSSKVLGNVGSTGKIQTSVQVTHPLKSNFNGGSQNMTNFLYYGSGLNPSASLETETFDTETYRLISTGYTSATYSDLNGSIYAWDSTQDLLVGTTGHTDGLLVFNGECLYPNSSYLTSTYGITIGNFSGVTNSPSNNVSYSGATGIRTLYRKYKSNQASTLSTLGFTVTHTGNLGNILTNSNDGGTPSGNNFKVEFMIKRAGGQTHGWFNPFASSNNEGVANTATSGVGGATCTLSVTPRVSSGDIIVMRVKVASNFTNRITNMSIDNI